ncbi:phospholipase D-like domain-containing protein (plasmid) [Haloferacaceae archaeon DSL9]
MDGKDASDRFTPSSTRHRRLTAKRRSFLKWTGGTMSGSAAAILFDSHYDHETTPPRIEPIFSYPTAIGVPDKVHEGTVRDLLKRATPGSEIHFAMFSLTRVGLAKAFIDAAERGVDVNILLDEHLVDSEAVQRLIAELGGYVSITAGAAVGTKHNHNKFLLLSELADGETDVVWQSTSNFTNTQLHRHNTSVVFRGDTALYDAYRSYWDDLFTGETDRHYNRTEQTDLATVSFSPRSDYDTHLRALENISPTRDATIRFSYSIWTEGRLDVVDRIAELVDQGCSVEVILEEDASTVSEFLRNAGATVLEYPSNPLPQQLLPIRSPNVHSKNMLIDADFDDGNRTVRRRLVYTGSQNLSQSGLSANDEVLLRIEDDDVYEQFVRDWRRVYERGRRLRGSW